MAVKAPEALTIAMMAERGMSQVQIAELLGRDRSTVARVIKSTKGSMVARAQEYADLHFEASQKAASMGNAVPMQWALERLGVVEDPKLRAEQNSGPRFNVQIGIALPGLQSVSNEPHLVSTSRPAQALVQVTGVSADDAAELEADILEAETDQDQA